MDKVKQAHYSEYDSNPDIMVSAPGRFHLIGEHSWYFRDRTLSMAVDLPVYVCVSIRNDSSLRFHFPQLKERKRSNVSTLKYRREDRWANALKAMIFGFISSGFECKGLNITVYSEILPSAGFGITTAIKLATATAIRHLFAPKCPEDVFLQCIEKGNKLFLNTGNYTADIFSALYSKSGFCLLTDHDALSREYVPFNFPDVSIILTDARVPRISVWDEESIRTPEYAQYLRELKIQKNGHLVYEESDVEINDVMETVHEDTRRRLLCIMKEYQFVYDAVDALKNDNFGMFARSVNKSHEMMRDLYSLSCPEIDWLIKRVQEFDMTSGRDLTACARITGKGFGRCTYTIIKTSKVDAYMQKLTEYERIFGFHPSCYVVKSANGVHIC